MNELTVIKFIIFIIFIFLLSVAIFFGITFYFKQRCSSCQNSENCPTCSKQLFTKNNFIILGLSLVALVTVTLAFFLPVKYIDNLKTTLSVGFGKAQNVVKEGINEVKENYRRNQPESVLRPNRPKSLPTELDQQINLEPTDNFNDNFVKPPENIEISSDNYYPLPAGINYLSTNIPRYEKEPLPYPFQHVVEQPQPQSDDNTVVNSPPNLNEIERPPPYLPLPSQGDENPSASSVNRLLPPIPENPPPPPPNQEQEHLIPNTSPNQEQEELIPNTSPNQEQEQEELIPIAQPPPIPSTPPPPPPNQKQELHEPIAQPPP